MGIQIGAMQFIIIEETQNSHLQVGIKYCSETNPIALDQYRKNQDL